MRYWVLLLFGLLTVMAGVFGFTSLGARSGAIAQILFYVFLAFFLLLAGMAASEWRHRKKSEEIREETSV